MMDCVVKTLLYFVLPTVIALYFFMNKKFSYFKDRNIPSNVHSFPNILGDLVGAGYKRHFTESLVDVYQKYKNKDAIVGFFQLMSPWYMITDLDVMKNVLIKDFNTFIDRGQYYNEEDDPLTGHLFNIEGEKWKLLRTKLSPTFTSGKIKMMYATIAEKGDELVEVLEKSIRSGPIEVKNISTRYTIDVIASAAFGLENHALQNKDAEILKMADDVFNIKGLKVFKFFILETFQEFSKFFHLKVLQQECANYFMNVIRSTVNYRESNKVQRPDFLNLLMQLKNKGSIDGEEASKDGRKFTFNELAAQSFIFFFAGFETSSTAMTFALYELAINQEIQDKAREEILTVIKAHDGKITYDALGEMHYLHMIFNETLRKHSPVPFLQRKAKYDYKVEGTNHTIPAGKIVIIPTCAIHYDERVYPDPQKFDPERFLPENIEARHNCAFLPFGDGNRNCIGSRFALVQAKFGLATILSNFKLRLSHKTKLPMKLDIKQPFLTADGGMWMNLEKI